MLITQNERDSHDFLQVATCCLHIFSWPFHDRCSSLRLSHLNAPQLNMLGDQLMSVTRRPFPAKLAPNWGRRSQIRSGDSHFQTSMGLRVPCCASTSQSLVAWRTKSLLVARRGLVFEDQFEWQSRYDQYYHVLSIFLNGDCYPPSINPVLYNQLVNHYQSLMLPCGFHNPYYGSPDWMYTPLSQWPRRRVKHIHSHE